MLPERLPVDPILSEMVTEIADHDYVQRLFRNLRAQCTIWDIVAFSQRCMSSQSVDDDTKRKIFIEVNAVAALEDSPLPFLHDDVASFLLVGCIGDRAIDSACVPSGAS